MSRPSRRTFLKRALAGMSTLCLPGLPVLQAQPWSDLRPVSRDDIERAFRECFNPLIGQTLVPATEEAIQEAALNTLRSGETQRLIGVQWIVTVKEPLKTETPPTTFHFGDPKFLGDAWHYYPDSDSWAHIVNGVVRDHNPPY